MRNRMFPKLPSRPQRSLSREEGSQWSGSSDYGIREDQTLTTFVFSLRALHSQLSQVCAQLIQRLHLNRLHTQFRSAFQIQSPIVDETALFRINLRSLNRETINAALGFS